MHRELTSNRDQSVSNGCAITRDPLRWVPRSGWSWSVVLLVAAWSMWSLRATLLSVSYLDDASVHEQMVRFATRSFQSGRNPLTEWFPYLGEGSPQFLHYQSLRSEEHTSELHSRQYLVCR